MGPEGSDLKEIRVLNRMLRYIPAKDGAPDRIEYEADPRHVEILVDQVLGEGAWGTKSVVTPGESVALGPDSDKPLGGDALFQYRSSCMRLGYLAQDRPDIEVAAPTRRDAREVEVDRGHLAHHSIALAPRSILALTGPGGLVVREPDAGTVQLQLGPLPVLPHDAVHIAGVGIVAREQEQLGNREAVTVAERLVVHAQVQGVCRELSAQSEFLQCESFRPGRPVPTHRLKASS